MGLKKIYDDAKWELEAGTRNRDFFVECVLPKVTKLAVRINADPDLEVSFQIAGDDGGCYIRRGSHCWWGFEARFRNKVDDSDAGKALLRLCGNMPDTAVMSDGTESDLWTDSGREKIIRDLVLQAARNAAEAERGSRLSAAVSAANRLPAGPANL